MATKQQIAEMTEVARAGFTAQGKPNPYLWSSANWLLFAFGMMMNASGRTLPRDTRTSRGDSVRNGDMVFKYHYEGDYFERIA